MSDTTLPPAFLDAPDFQEGPAQKRVVTHPEWAVQRGIMRFCKRAIACEFEFASHDRGRARSEMEHIFEAARGIRRDWPDVELALAGGRTFRCELKAPGVGIDISSGQFRMIHRLSRLGHPTIWANSVRMFGSVANTLGIPLLPNWGVIAAHEDELVAADIRKQAAKAAAKRGGVVKKGRKPRRRTTPRDRRASAIYQAALPR